MADLSRVELRQLAVLGARARLTQLQAEEASLRRAFPELSRAGARAASSAPEGDEAKAGPGRRRRNKRRMSPAARKAVSERMRKYWAERRKAKAK